MWFFIEGNTDRLEDLGRRRLNAVSMEITYPLQASGISFPEEDAKQILSIFGLSQDVEKIDTDVDGVVLLNYRKTKHVATQREEKVPTVKTKMWKTGNALISYFESSLKEELLSVVKKDIEIHDRAGALTLPLNDKIFRVLLNSSHEKNNKEMIQTPAIILGKKSEASGSKSFLPYDETGKSFLIVDDFGYVLAELIDDNLFIHYNINHYETHDTTQIFHQLIKKVAQYLKCSPRERREIVKSNADILAQGTIQIRAWKSSDLSGLARFASAIRKKIIPILKTDVTVSYKKGGREESIEDGKFHIFFWATTIENENGRHPAPQYIFETRLHYRDDAYQPFSQPDKCITIFDDSTGFAVAELIGHNLFIHPNICYANNSDEEKIFNNILDRIPYEALLDPEKYAETKRQQILEKQRLEAEEEKRELEAFAEMNKRTKTLYAKACLNRLHRVISESNDIVFRKNTDITSISAKIITLSRKIAHDNSILGLTKTLEGKNRELFGAEYDKILKIPGVIGLTVKENKKIIIYTEEIKIVHDGHIYLIGQFLIAIDTSSKNSFLRILNITNTGAGPGANPTEDFDGNTTLNRHHPYICKRGIPNLGKLGSEIPIFIAENQFAITVNLIMQFLRKVNPNDYAGRGLKFWPTEKPVKTSVPVVKSKKIKRKKKAINQQAVLVA